MPRKKPKGFAGEKSKQNPEIQKLDQSDHIEDNEPPFWIKLFVDAIIDLLGNKLKKPRKSIWVKV